MKVTVTVSGEYIGNGNGAKAPVKTYRKHPASFDAAAKAGAYYAKRDQENYVIIWGSQYGHGLWRVMREDRLDRLPRLDGRYNIAVAKPDGGIVRGVVVYEVVRGRTLRTEATMNNQDDLQYDSEVGWYAIFFADRTFEVVQRETAPALGEYAGSGFAAGPYFTEGGARDYGQMLHYREQEA